MWIDSNQDDEQNKQTNLNSPSVGSGGGTGAATGGTSIPGANPSTISPIQSNQPQQKFATVQDYLGANKPQGQALGSDLANKLTESANSEKGAINTAAQQTQNDITAGSTVFNPDVINKAVASPTDVTNSPDQLTSFLGQWNASYNGPQSFEKSANYTPAAAAANEAGNKAAEVASPGGREQLIGETYGVYGQGNRGLDQALVQTSDAFPTIQATQPNFKSIQDYLSSTGAGLNTQVQQAQTNTAQAQQQARDLFNSGVTNLGTQVGNEAQTAKTVGTNATNPATQLLANLPPNPSDVDLSIAGMTRAEYNGIIRSINSTTNNANISNPVYATNPQYSSDLARYLAAQNLQKQALASQF